METWRLSNHRVIFKGCTLFDLLEFFKRHLNPAVAGRATVETQSLAVIYLLASKRYPEFIARQSADCM